MGEEELGGGCLEVVGAEVRPEDPLLMVPADRLISRALCGRGMYLPSLENQIEDKRWCEELLEADQTEFRAATQTAEEMSFQVNPGRKGNALYKSHIFFNYSSCFIYKRMKCKFSIPESFTNGKCVTVLVLSKCYGALSFRQF